MFIIATSYLSPGASLFSTYTVNIACSAYFSVGWLYTAQSTTETITITTYNAPSTTYIDDVSIYDVTTSQELLTNGGFESGSTGWTGSATTCIGSSGPRTGSRGYSDAATSLHGNISQSVSTTVGHILFISFYINWGGSGTIYNNIIIAP